MVRRVLLHEGSGSSEQLSKGVGVQFGEGGGRGVRQQLLALYFGRAGTDLTRLWCAVCYSIVLRFFWLGVAGAGTDASTGDVAAPSAAATV